VDRNVEYILFIRLVVTSKIIDEIDKHGIRVSRRNNLFQCHQIRIYIHHNIFDKKKVQYKYRVYFIIMNIDNCLTIMVINTFYHIHNYIQKKRTKQTLINTQTENLSMSP
jgi:hypothetical protein